LHICTSCNATYLDVILCKPAVLYYFWDCHNWSDLPCPKNCFSTTGEGEEVEVFQHNNASPHFSNFVRQHSLFLSNRRRKSSFDQKQTTLRKELYS
jgi:hypothetical protein